MEPSRQALAQGSPIKLQSRVSHEASFEERVQRAHEMCGALACLSIPRRKVHRSRTSPATPATVVRAARTGTDRLCNFFAFVPERRKSSPSSCDFFASVPTGGPKPPSGATPQNSKVHFPSSEACRLRQRQALARRPAPSGGAGHESGRLKGSPLSTAGTEAEKSHAFWPQKRTAGTEAKKSHSVLAHTDTQACTQVRGRAIRQDPQARTCARPWTPRFALRAHREFDSGPTPLGAPPSRAPRAQKDRGIAPATTLAKRHTAG